MQISHPDLGVLTWQPGGDHFLGTLGGDPELALYAEPADPQDPVGTLGRGLDTLASVPSQLPRLMRAAAEHYLDLYNDTWSEQDDDITADEFAARIRPLSVSAYHTGECELSIDDAGMFHGHVILLTVDADGSVADAQLAG